jgi:hypothetical protein
VIATTCHQNDITPSRLGIRKYKQRKQQIQQHELCSLQPERPESLSVLMGILRVVFQQPQPIEIDRLGSRNLPQGIEDFSKGREILSSDASQNDLVRLATPGLDGVRSSSSS